MDHQLSLFSNKNIKKSFKDQSLFAINKQKPEDLFIDDLFPANITSLNGNLNRSSISISTEVNRSDLNFDGIKWMRLSQMQVTNNSIINATHTQEIKNFSIMNEQIKIDFSSKKCVNMDNNFKAIISEIIKYPQLIYNLLRENDELNQLGYYELCLFIEGQWQIVIIDDFIPVKKNNIYEFAFSQPDNDNSIWLILLEKAWSKVKGNYYNSMTDSSPYEIFHALTGFPFEIVDLNKTNKDFIWKRIEMALISEEIIFTGNESNKLKSRNGLLNVYYKILDIRESNLEEENIKLIVLKSENISNWTGTWSKNSHRWDRESIKLLKKENDSDCIYMDYDDFLIFFSSINTSRIVTKENNSITYINNNLLESDAHILPDVYNFKINTNSKENDTQEIIFSFLTQNWKYNRNIMTCDVNNSFFIVLAKFDFEKNNFVIKETKYSNKFSDIHFKTSLESGSYIMWVYFNTCKEITSQTNPQFYSLKILTPSNVIFSKKVIKDTNFELISEIVKNSIYNDNSNDIDYCLDDVYLKHKSQLLNSGIGFLFYSSNSSLKTYKLEIDYSELENMKLLNNPFNSSTLYVNKVSKNVLLAIVKDTSKKYSFKITYKLSLCDNFKRDKKLRDVSGCVEKDFEIYNNEDLNYSTHDLEKMNFEIKSSLNYLSEEEFYLNIKDKNPIYFDEIIKLEILEKTIKKDFKKIELLWVVEKEYTNGLYTGQINVLKGNKHGKGIYIWTTGEMYFGYWEDDMQHYNGTIYKNKEEILYRGEFKKGKKNGEGVLHLLNGDIYEGNFKDDLFEGLGLYKWKEGGVSKVGIFLHDRPSEIAVLDSSNGNIFIKN